ncbi:hypothetical protein B0H14DRAFT_2591322 [Mycena olivaceomarginata]|nr:hypothetical protein B0H14DRAFT_2591322 [Mycena olivaceomarginata]
MLLRGGLVDSVNHRRGWAVSNHPTRSHNSSAQIQPLFAVNHTIGLWQGKHRTGCGTIASTTLVRTVVGDFWRRTVSARNPSQKLSCVIGPSHLQYLRPTFRVGTQVWTLPLTHLRPSSTDARWSAVAEGNRQTRLCAHPQYPNSGKNTRRPALPEVQRRRNVLHLLDTEATCRRRLLSEGARASLRVARPFEDAEMKVITSSSVLELKHVRTAPVIMRRSGSGSLRKRAGDRKTAFVAIARLQGLSQPSLGQPLKWSPTTPSTHTGQRNIQEQEAMRLRHFLGVNRFALGLVLGLGPEVLDRLAIVLLAVRTAGTGKLQCPAFLSTILAPATESTQAHDNASGCQFYAVWAGRVRASWF